jgi:hypothetical protein
MRPKDEANSWEWYEANFDELNPYLEEFSKDPLYIKKSWTTVIVYRMTHYNYLYE